MYCKKQLYQWMIQEAIIGLHSYHIVLIKLWGRKAVNKNLSSRYSKCAWHQWHRRHQELGRNAGSVPDPLGDLRFKEILR